MPRRQITRRCGIYEGARPPCAHAEGAGCVLGADEMEALRLGDLMGLMQVDAARRMGISQSTFQRILTAAHRKVAASLVDGRPLTVARAWDASWKGAETPLQQEKNTGGMSMTTHIALPTDDGTTLCQHFGRARYYKVVEITDGKVRSSELRDKFAHVHGDETQEHAEANEQEAHGRMADAAHGCDTIIAGGMGMGAINALSAAGYTVMQTDMASLDEIVEACCAGTFVNFAGQVSCHHEGQGHGAC